MTLIKTTTIELYSVVFIAAYLIYLYCMMPPLMNSDVPWHLAAGDTILAHGIPDHDPWSFTAGSTPWYNISWLWDAIISLVVQIAGIAWLYCFTATIGAATIAMLAWSLKQRGHISNGYILITCAITGMVLLQGLVPAALMLYITFTLSPLQKLVVIPDKVSGDY